MENKIMLYCPSCGKLSTKYKVFMEAKGFNMKGYQVCITDQHYSEFDTVIESHMPNYGRDTPEFAATDDYGHCLNDDTRLTRVVVTDDMYNAETIQLPSDIDELISNYSRKLLTKAELLSIL